MVRKPLYAALAAGAIAIAIVGPATPAQALQINPGSSCFDPTEVGAAARGTTNARANDHRDISASEQRQIEARTTKLLAAKARASAKPGATTGSSKASIPVYVHVMAAADGSGDVSNTKIADQITVLNQTYGGNDVDGRGYNTGIAFTLAGVDRFYNNTWHKDRQSTTYRAQTRQGGKNALNIWLVDFKYLGIATFPWDYSRNPAIDGIRVHWDSVPGGSIANYNLGETATHEAGHWLGLYHTFQGGCTATNDEVADTPAQSSSTSGCPIGRDSCSLPGLDPIHNYMDYSYDDCYFEFTAGQSTRMDQMWTAYRA
jgi:hypothetical protein